MVAGTAVEWVANSEAVVSVGRLVCISLAILVTVEVEMCSVAVDSDPAFADGD